MKKITGHIIIYTCIKDCDGINEIFSLLIIGHELTSRE